MTSAERYQIISVLPVILLIKIPVFYFFGLYRGMWRYMSTTDVMNLTKAALFSFLLVVTCVLSANRFEGLSRSIFFLDAVFTFLLISGHRFAIRFFYKNVSGSRKLVPVLPFPHKNKKKLLLIGSVIPLFKHQIELGGPVTVTHPEVTRYFMSIEEAAKLTLQASAMGEGGEIFILKMGEPIKIDQLARDLIMKSGTIASYELIPRYHPCPY